MYLRYVLFREYHKDFKKMLWIMELGIYSPSNTINKSCKLQTFNKGPIYKIFRRGEKDNINDKEVRQRSVSSRYQPSKFGSTLDSKKSHEPLNETDIQKIKTSSRFGGKRWGHARISVNLWRHAPTIMKTNIRHINMSNTSTWMKTAILRPDT